MINQLPLVKRLDVSPPERQPIAQIRTAPGNDLPGNDLPGIQVFNAAAKFRVQQNVNGT